MEESGVVRPGIETPPSTPDQDEVVVLLIDDQPIVADSLRSMLADEADVVVHHESDPEQAISTADDVQPTVVLQDLVMPGVDGLDLIRQFRAHMTTHDVPIVVLSSTDDAESKARAFESGANDYIVKLPDSREVIARLRYHSQAFRNLRERMEVAKHRSLSQMVAGVAHELNTPMGIVRTATDMIAQRVGSEAVRQVLAADPRTRDVCDEILEASELAQRNIVRAHTLTEQFKKVSVQQLADQRETVRLPDLVQDVVDLYSIEARRAGMSVTVVNDLDDAGDWDGYPGYLSQVLLNCLTNAQRYAYSAGGPVEIRIADGRRRAGAPPWFVIRVCDEGQGMPAQVRERIFEPFFTTARGSGGSGLGMAIVYGLVTEGLRGVLRVESEEGEGTVVEARIPRAVPSAT